jgi:hypothetical protein
MRWGNIIVELHFPPAHPSDLSAASSLTFS